MAALACSFPLQCLKTQRKSNPQSHLEFASLRSNIKSKETGVVDFTEPSKVYENVKQDVPSSDASQIANNLSNLGQNCNREDISTGDWQRDKMLEKIEFECTA
ncbi:uncharacterized protein LOC111467650 [Cucurbita maxima]|uniref:Uncharacterized protein LOC111467650 n=1 Tax=Cucurbita maxima TaxID=3661 RepID=A0A6J1HTE5_CUCMA|nr:uncharacterized protein LOC111467650 [Cucurbita maxima]XP_022968397.1 uncharacterized protein LOC111467650 [Cucurbita maxima]XP_022968398.1 uncharacterized protein LOC111467650 [Cucurbita maxima]